MTAAIWFLGFSVAVLAIMLAPWAVNEADKIVVDEEDAVDGNTKETVKGDSK